MCVLQRRDSAWHRNVPTAKATSASGRTAGGKDDRWEGRYTAGRGPDAGKPIYKNVLGKTLSEVRDRIKAPLEAAGKLDTARTGQYTIGQWMDIWFEDYAKIHVRPSSHQTYRGYIQNHIRPNIGALPLEKVTTLDLQKFCKKLLMDGRVDVRNQNGSQKDCVPRPFGTFTRFSPLL